MWTITAKTLREKMTVTMRMMILCYCNGIRERKFDISRSYQPFVYQDVVADVQSGGIVAEKELQLLNKPNHVLTPEEDENQCRKAGYVADMLGTMMTNEKVPLYYKEFDYLLCDLNYDAEEFLVHGKMGIVRDDDEYDVLGRTLSGRPLLSSRRYFRRIGMSLFVVMWQIKQLNDTDVEITEWDISHQN
ncbi:hypothetical protein HID58_052379 [Brassica napus]|uniref:Uncharacterized protein n=1 Tax=Brassica napus TaxID=3708 RepID=A0ABQ8ABM0_BRANA|nr:hypothetical protein HID58_052379 [Brassica napus]